MIKSPYRQRRLFPRCYRFDRRHFHGLCCADDTPNTAPVRLRLVIDRIAAVSWMPNRIQTAPSRRLQRDPQAPRHRYRLAHWTPAVAQTTAPRLCAFGRRCCSCLAAAAPLRRPAIRLLACLRLAGGYLVLI